ncbi:hypothetical protein ACFOYU_11975 [Microvirga sp. GCM10011540]|uniref:hypothetical protein n=1 Tax=Microvirga sp. GCM10011540 TaxID=3317338 RepID=UPI003613C79E
MTGGKRAVLAVALAYVLVLQGLLLSMAGAVQAGSGHLPQAILCLTDADRAPDDPAPAKAHDGLCCLLGCHGAGSAGGPLPAAAMVAPVPRRAVAADARPATPVLPVASTILPVGSRAPPRLG